MDDQKESSFSQPALSACQELHDMLPAYVIGALNADELVRIQTLFEECPEAKGELKDYAAIAVRFLERIPPVEPPPAVLDNLINALHSETPAAEEIPVTPKGDAER